MGDALRSFWGGFRTLPVVVSLPILIAALLLMAFAARGMVSAVTAPDPTEAPVSGRTGPCVDPTDIRCDRDSFQRPPPGG